MPGRRPKKLPAEEDNFDVKMERLRVLRTRPRTRPDATLEVGEPDPVECTQDVSATQLATQPKLAIKPNTSWFRRSIAQEGPVDLDPTQTQPDLAMEPQNNLSDGEQPPTARRLEPIPEEVALAAPPTPAPPEALRY